MLNSSNRGWVFRIRLQSDGIPAGVQLTKAAQQLVHCDGVRLPAVLRYSHVEVLVKFAQTEAFVSFTEDPFTGISSPVRFPSNNADGASGDDFSSVPGVLTFLSAYGARMVLNRQSFADVCEAASAAYAPSPPSERAFAIPSPNQDAIVQLTLEVVDGANRTVSYSPESTVSSSEIMDAPTILSHSNSKSPGGACVVPNMSRSNTETFQHSVRGQSVIAPPTQRTTAEAVLGAQTAERDFNGTRPHYPTSMPPYFTGPATTPAIPRSEASQWHGGLVDVAVPNAEAPAKTRSIPATNASGVRTSPTGTSHVPLGHPLLSGVPDASWHPLEEMVDPALFKNVDPERSYSRQAMTDNNLACSAQEWLNQQRSSSARAQRTASEMSNHSHDNITNRTSTLDEEVQKVLFADSVPSNTASIRSTDAMLPQEALFPVAACKTPSTSDLWNYGDGTSKRCDAPATALGGRSPLHSEISPNGIRPGVVGQQWNLHHADYHGHRHASAQGLSLCLETDADYRAAADKYRSLMEESHRKTDAIWAQRPHSNSYSDVGPHLRHLSWSQSGANCQMNNHQLPVCVAGENMCGSKHLMEVIPCGHRVCKQCLERSIVAQNSHRGCPACGLTVRDLKAWNTVGKPPLPPRPSKQVSGSFEGNEPQQRVMPSPSSGCFRNGVQQPTTVPIPAAAIQAGAAVSVGSNVAEDQFSQAQLVDCLTTLLCRYNQQDFGSAPTTPPFIQAPEQTPPGGAPPDQDYRCFEARGPRPLLQVLLALESANALTPPMLAAVLLQFLPTIFQRVQKKTGRVNKGPGVAIAAKLNAQHPGVYKALIKALHLLDEIPDLGKFSMQFRASLSGKPGAPRLGTLLLSTLQSFSSSPFAVQASLMEALAPDLLPHWRFLLKWCSSKGAEAEDAGVTLVDMTHWGTECSGCGLKNIYGPRFHCDTCATHGSFAADLCGPCYIRRLRLHDNSHSFRCLFRDVRHKSESLSAGLPNLSLAQQVVNSLNAVTSPMNPAYEIPRLNPDGLLSPEVISRLHQATGMASKIGSAANGLLPRAEENPMHGQFSEQLDTTPITNNGFGGPSEIRGPADVNRQTLIPHGDHSSEAVFSRARHQSLEGLHHPRHNVPLDVVLRNRRQTLSRASQDASHPQFRSDTFPNAPQKYSMGGEVSFEAETASTLPSGTCGVPCALTSMLTGSFESITSQDQVLSQTVYRLLQSNANTLDPVLFENSRGGNKSFEAAGEHEGYLGKCPAIPAARAAPISAELPVSGICECHGVSTSPNAYPNRRNCVSTDHLVATGRGVLR